MSKVQQVHLRLSRPTLLHSKNDQKNLP